MIMSWLSLKEYRMYVERVICLNGYEYEHRYTFKTNCQNCIENNKDFVFFQSRLRCEWNWMSGINLFKRKWDECTNWRVHVRDWLVQIEGIRSSIYMKNISVSTQALNILMKYRLLLEMMWNSRDLCKKKINGNIHRRST